MTKEEKAEKWFHNIPDTEFINMETKIKICSKVSRKMLGIFLIILIAECLLAFLINDGAIFTWLSNTINSISDGSSAKNYYKTLALTSSALLIPFIVIPVIVMNYFKNRLINSEVKNALQKK